LGEQFPDQLRWHDLVFRLSYQFEPGGQSDGVSVTIPVALLNRTPRYLFEWLVPGLLREKCVQLVKSLPKEKRKRLVPVPDYVERALVDLEPGNSSITAALSERLSPLGGVALQPGDFDLERLDDYYRMNIRVVDARGKLMAQGRDLASLIEQFRDVTRDSVTSDRDDSPVRSDLQRWDFGDVPREWRFKQAGVEIQSFPALVDKGGSVAIELCDYPWQARLNHRLGVLHLCRAHNAQQVRYLRKQMLRGNEFNLLLAAGNLERAVLVNDLVDAAYVQAMVLNGELPYRQSDFVALLHGAQGNVINRANELENIFRNALPPLAEIRRRLSLIEAGRWEDSRADIGRQLDALLCPAFQRDTPGEWLAQLPRYMKALLNRVERLPGQYGKDQKHTAMLQEVWEPLQEAQAARPGLMLLSDAACLYRWMLEEFRVSLFAQNLGTRQAVSSKRLQQQWQAVEAWLVDNPQ